MTSKLHGVNATIIIFVFVLYCINGCERMILHKAFEEVVTIKSHTIESYEVVIEFSEK